MLLTLVDSLRCPAHEDESPLVLSVERWNGPRVVEGVLGCPHCHARYRIQSSRVDFAPVTAGAETTKPVVRQAAPVDPVRLAAQLALGEPGGVFLLTGRYASVAQALSAFVELVTVLIDGTTVDAPDAIAITLGDRLPFVDSALRGAAVDADRCSPEFLAEVRRCVRAGGRVVAWSEARVPPGLNVIAKDDREWVAEVSADAGVTTPVPLRRADPR